MRQRTINLFMWGYQPHFRAGLQHRAEHVLQSIALGITPQALLIGVRVPGSDRVHEVCVEPEHGPWDPKLFFPCGQRSLEIYANHPDHNIIYGDAPSMNDLPEHIRRASVVEAVQEVLASYDAAHGTASFCGAAARLAGYHVVPVLQVDQKQLHDCPRLPSPVQVQDYRSPIGLIEAAISSILADATLRMFLPDPGRSLRSINMDPHAVLRDAGDRFCASLTLVTQDLMLQGLFQALNSLAAVPYEGAGAIGELIFAAKNHESIDVNVIFSKPVSLYEPRLARKAIEMSGDGLTAVCFGEKGISGLGVLRDPMADDVLMVHFIGHHKWEIAHRQKVIMQVEFGVPKLPIAKLRQREFTSQVKRQFTGISDSVVLAIWHVVEAAMEQRHGTMIVISADAAAEAARLNSQAMRIEPTALTADLVRRLTRIDGAVLVGTDGVCYSIGTILDGRVSRDGDASRGARYNSALRYTGDNPTQAMCVVVSEDGYVDVIPRLRPQISRTAIADQVELLRSQDIDTYHKTRAWLDQHRFYLTQSQCDAINCELKRIDSALQDVGEIRLAIDEFVPNPQMNETYYLDGGHTDEAGTSASA